MEEKVMKNLKEQIETFSDESFFGHYETLVQAGIESGRSDDVMLALSFLSDLKRLLATIKTAIEENGSQI